MIDTGKAKWELTEGEREFRTWIRTFNNEVLYKVNTAHMVTDTHSGK